MADPHWIGVGRIRGSQGVQGALKIEPYAAASESVLRHARRWRLVEAAEPSPDGPLQGRSPRPDPPPGPRPLRRSLRRAGGARRGAARVAGRGRRAGRGGPMPPTRCASGSTAWELRGEGAAGREGALGWPAPQWPGNMEKNCSEGADATATYVGQL